MRTIIDITEHQNKVLGQLAKKHGLSRSAIIRTAIDQLIDHETARADEDVKRSVFGIWKGRVVDGLEYEKQIRNEWEDR